MEYDMTGRCKGCGRFVPLLRLGEALVCETCAHGGQVDGDAAGDVVLLIGGHGLRLAATAGKSPIEFADAITRYRAMAKLAKPVAD
jgi:hypothetical protein